MVWDCDAPCLRLLKIGGKRGKCNNKKSGLESVPGSFQLFWRLAKLVGKKIKTKCLIGRTVSAAVCRRRIVVDSGIHTCRVALGFFHLFRALLADRCFRRIQK